MKDKLIALGYSEKTAEIISDFIGERVVFPETRYHEKKAPIRREDDSHSSSSSETHGRH